MAWISLNPIFERDEVIYAALALSGQHEFAPLLSDEILDNLADLYNNADSLGLDIYRVGSLAEDGEAED